MEVQADATVQFDSFKCADTATLIKSVEKHEIIYANKNTWSATSNETREAAWRQVFVDVFPNYENLNDVYKLAIEKSIRNRWRGLRRTLVKSQHPKNKLCENPKTLETIKSLQFLIPHIQFNRLKAGNSDNNDTSSRSGNENSNFEVPDFSLGDYLSLQMGEAPNERPIEESELCFKEEEEKAIEYISIHSESDDDDAQSEQDCRVTNSTSRSRNTTRDTPAKRSRCCVEDDIDEHQNVFDMFNKTDLSSQDEDKMFFLSILSDFSKVSPLKKLKVKAKIVQAIAEAFD